MRILVTGAGGFIGSHLVPKLIDNHEVLTLNRYVVGRLGEEVPCYFCDIRDYDAVRRTIREVQPEALIHLACVSPQSYSYDHPHEVIDTNLMGTINLAEACRREVPHFQHFLFAGSAEEYGNNGFLLQKENSPRVAVSPYSVAKIASEDYLNYMQKAYKFPITNLRNTNTYGRKKERHFVIEKVITQALQGNEIRLGTPDAIRDFQYVEDHVSSYLTVLNNPSDAIGRTFNFGTGVGITITELVVTIKEMTGFQGSIVFNTMPARPLDIQTLVIDASFAKYTLGWKSKWSLTDGLRATIDYWRQHL